MSPMYLLLIVLFAVSYTLLSALSGLMLGAKMPTLTWTNEIMPIKQSAPVVISLFGGMGYTVLLFAGFLLLPGWMLGFTGYMTCMIGYDRGKCDFVHMQLPVASENRNHTIRRAVISIGIVLPSALYI